MMELEKCVENKGYVIRPSTKSEGFVVCKEDKIVFKAPKKVDCKRWLARNM